MTLKLTDPSPSLWGENLPFWFRAAARVGSIFLMLSGLVYWADILGVFGDSGLERGAWQEVALRVVLACSFLIATIGVWQLAFWGVVMWALSSMLQGMATFWFDSFAYMQSFLNLAHVIGLLALIGSAGWIYFKASRPGQ